MRKNIFRGIIAATLGLTMAIGVSAAAANNRNEKAVHAENNVTVTYAIQSTTSASKTSGKAPSGSSVSYTQTGSTAKQATNGNSMTMTISGYDGCTITGLSITAKSNSSKGTGSLTFASGSTTIGAIAESAFNSSNWYGAWSTSYVSVEVECNSTVVGEDEDLVIYVACKSGSSNYNSIYFETATITYDEPASGDPEKEDVVLSCDDLELDVSDDPIPLAVTASSGGNPVSISPLTFNMTDESVATVSDSGVVTPVAIGETTLTIGFDGDGDYNPTSKVINVSVSDRTISNLVFTAACGGSGTADDGAVWTVTSDGTESNFDNTHGIHYGTKSANVTYLQLSSSSFDNYVRRVVVRARDAQAVATISVTVGGKAFVCSNSDTLTNDSADYTFLGYAVGTVVVRVDRGSSMTQALYVKSIIVKHTADTLQSIVLSGNFDTTFDQNGEFNHDGMVVTANYSDAPSENVATRATWTGYNLSNSGTQTVTVTYGTKSAAYEITVNAAVMYSVGGTIVNGSLSSTSNVRENNELSITINANDRCDRPATLEVTMDGDSLSLGSEYTYNSSTGAFYIEHVTGNVVINGECAKIHGLWDDDPFTVEEAKDAIDDANNHSIQNAYVSGIISQIDSFSSPNITYWISDDGTTTNQLEVYRGLNKQGETPFASVDDIEIDASVVVYGNLTLYQSTTYEFASGNRLVSYTAAPRYTVSFNSLGGNSVDPISNIKKGACVSTLPEATKANDTVNQKRYELAGWYTVADPANPVFEEGNRFTTSTPVNSNLTVYAKYNEISYYVVAFNTNGGNLIDSQNVDSGETVVLPSDPTKASDASYTYSFEGWYTNVGLTDPFDDSEPITSNLTVYAKYTAEAISSPASYLNSSTSVATIHGSETPADSGSVTKTINALVEENSWTISTGQDVTCYESFNLNSNVTISTTGAANCGSVWGTTTYDWRLYQNKSGNVIVSASNGYELTSVTFTYSISNTGTLKQGETTISSGAAVSLSGTSATFTVENTGSATNGQVRITNISVSYERALSISNVAIRFGATIAKSEWDAIKNHDGWNITDYGVMLMAADDMDGYSSVQDAFEKGANSSILIDIHKCQNETPYADPYLDGDNYLFTVKVSFPNNSNYYDDVIYAVPYVVVSGQYYFLDEMHTSVQDLADDYYDSGYEYLSDAALDYLRA